MGVGNHPLSNGNDLKLDEENKLASVRIMEGLRKRALPGSICYVLSKIYFSVEDEDIKLDCRRATYYAKKMGAKLKEYKAEKREQRRTTKT
jgi:hypothetical protein